MKSDFIVAVISDIHFGAMDCTQLLNELNLFLEYLIGLERLNLIIIDGDLYDKKLSLNSEHTLAAFHFMTKLTNIAKDKEAKIRIIKGTLSHDNNQLENLMMFSDVCDFKIFNSLETEVIDDVKILYIPEEYIEDEDYFEQVYSQDADLCFGHGMIKEAAFVGSKQESAITLKKAPIFDTDKLLENIKGIVMFGHIHNRMKIKERFYYCGSYSRLSS